MGHKKLKRKLELCRLENSQLNDTIRVYCDQIWKYGETVGDLTARVESDDADIAEYRAKIAELSSQNKELHAKVLSQAESLIMGR